MKTHHIVFLFILLHAQFLCADSIIFLPDSNKPSKPTYQDNFGNVTKDSDLQIFDIQKKGFNAKDSRGFKELHNDGEDKKIQIPQDSIKPPQIQQEDLPTEYSNAFETSMISSSNSNIESNKLAQNTRKATRIYERENIPSVANGTTFIAVSKKKKPQKLHIKGKEFPWIAHPKDSKKKIAFVAIPYRAEPGIFSLNDTISIKIVHGEYKKEKINIAKVSKVKPDVANSRRIVKELAEANAIYRTYTKKRYWHETFIPPLDSVITSPFGSARIFNNEVKSFHAGTDFRATIGTPIHAINDGIIVIAKERFLAGKSVVISHGEGIYSMYYHCSEMKVKVGQKVKKGQIIALSGDTGRVSGAHLHFGMMVNGVQIDPLDFIKKINALF